MGSVEGYAESRSTTRPRKLGSTYSPSNLDDAAGLRSRMFSELVTGRRFSTASNPWRTLSRAWAVSLRLPVCDEVLQAATVRSDRRSSPKAAFVPDKSPSKLRDIPWNMAMITGATELLVHIGDPIAQARAPMLVNPLLDRQGRNAILIPLHVTSDHLGKALDGVRATENIRGGIVTMPHKVAVADLADELTLEARVLGACNVFRRDRDGRITGSMLDGEGFVAALVAAGTSVRDKQVFLAGAGGVALGIAFSLAKHGAAGISVFNRSLERTEALRSKVGVAFPDVQIRILPAPDPSGCDIAVNATALGMKASDPVPMQVEQLTPSMVAAEVVISDEPTPFLAAAAMRGCQIQLGLAMLEAQIGLMIAFMLGAPVTHPP